MPPRVLTGKGAAPERPAGWNPAELHEHIRGRAKATVQVLIGVAVLRSANVLPASTVVTVTGAKWQDWNGTEKQPRAHRFPCNPQINGRDLPDWATPSDLVRELFEAALSITDPLLFHVNYADSRFEDLGGIEAARKSIEAVITRQKPGAPVAHDVVLSAWQQVAWPGYVEAWERAARDAHQRIVRESPRKFAERVRKFKPTAPTHDLETVVDVAYDAKRSTKLVSNPDLLTRPGFASVLATLGVQERPTA